MDRTQRVNAGRDRPRPVHDLPRRADRERRRCPTSSASFNVGEAGLQWVVAAYSLGMAMFIMSGGDARRPARPPPLVHRRHRGVHAGLDRVRARAVARGAEHRARRAGRRCGHRQRDVAGARERRVSRSRSRRRGRSASGPRSRAWAPPSVPRSAGSSSSTGAGAASFSSTCRSASLVVVADAALRRRIARRAAAHVSTSPGQLLFVVDRRRARLCGDRRPEARMDVPDDPRAVRHRGRERPRDLRARASGGRADPMMDVTLFRDPAYALAIGTICVGVLLDLRHAAADHAVPAERARLSAAGDRPHDPAVLRGA